MQPHSTADVPASAHDPSAAGGDRLDTALVVGASRGLGLLVARQLGRRGHHVVLAARHDAELDRAVEQLSDEGIQASSVVLNVTDRDAVTAAVRKVEREHGGIDVLLHVAGVIQVGPLEAMTPQRFDEAIDIMLKGPVNTALAVVPGMRERGRGRIGIVTSIGGVISVPHLLPYSTAKFGAVGFAEGLSAELAGTGVTVTTIVPGLMRTGSHLHAQFTGNAAAEYAWFAPSASLPGVSMDADTAADRMVAATLAGRTTITLTPVAQLGRLVAGVLPGTTTRLMGLAARVMPNGSDTRVREGMDARDELSPRARRIVGLLTTLGDRVAQRTNETMPSPHVPSSQEPDAGCPASADQH